MARSVSVQGRAAFTVEGNEVRETGRRMGQLVKEFFVPGVQDLVQALETDGHPLRTLLLFVLSLRARRHSRGLWTEVLALLGQPSTSRPRWFALLMRETFAIYCALRRASAPNSRQPVFHPQTATPVGRQVARQLVFHGVSLPQSAKWMLAREAQRNLRQLWGQMAGRGVVMWFDNFYKPRYVYNPNRLRGTLNATVMAVLGAVAMPQGHRWPELHELDGCLQRAVDHLWRAFPRLLQRLQAVAALSLRPQDFRVPLDKPRRGVTSVPWRPFSLNDDVVQTQRELLKVLRFCHRIASTHVQPPMPLLVDENIAYRVHKLCYSTPLQAWGVRQYLRDLPVLYGVWHPYKYVVIMVHRKFLALFAFLLRGTLRVGESVPSSLKLRTLEIWLGAMILVPERERRDVRLLAQRLQHQLTVVDTRIEQLLQQWHRRPRAGTLHSTAALVDDILNEVLDPAAFTNVRDYIPQYAVARAEHAHQLQRNIRQAWQARRLLNVQSQCAAAMDVLLNEFAPACLVLGTMVRQCHWAWHQSGTGRQVRDLLSYCVLLLVRLLEGREQKEEYVRTLGSALLLWTDWHDAVPASWFSEEPNEASLSRLSSLCKRHTQHISTVDVHELWMNVTPGSTEPHDLHTGGVSRDTAAAVLHHVHQFLRDHGRGVTCLPYNPQGVHKLSSTVADWPESNNFPNTMQRRPTRAQLKSLLTSVRRTLHSQQDPTGEFETALDQTFPRLPDAEAQGSMLQLQNFHSQHRDTWHTSS